MFLFFFFWLFLFGGVTPATVAESETQQDDCVARPDQERCTNFTLPQGVVQEEVAALCEQMPHMIGCTINNICDAHGNLKAGSPYCLAFSIYKDICSGDMGRMSPCANYTNMCVPIDSKVKECSIKSLPLPSEGQVSNWITQMCNAMQMDGCKECDLRKLAGSNRMAGLDCDLLTVYSKLCLSMPSMSECKAWTQLCQVIPDWPICPSGDGGDHPPIMRMYFHTGYVDYVLLEGWIPRNFWEYLLTFVAIVLLGMLYEALKAVHAILEERWKPHDAYDDVDEPPQQANRFRYVPFRWAVDVPRALLVASEVALGLVLMLVAMTFNVGLFVAVCCGSFFGSLLIGRFSVNNKKAFCH